MMMNERKRDDVWLGEKLGKAHIAAGHAGASKKLVGCVVGGRASLIGHDFLFPKN